MKHFFFFLIFLFLFFAAGFFLDAAFYFRGIFTNIITLWFFIAASYWLRPYEIVYAGWFMGLIYGFFAVGPAWFWLFVFFAISFVMLAAHSLAGASGRFQFFFFVLAGLAGALLVRIAALFFAEVVRARYGTVWHYVASPTFGREIALSAAFLLCVAVAAYGAGRKERIYYV